MLKLFRNIRRKHLRDGKTAAYLKYAVGEIVLVVIGIPIALQINNWNEARTSRQPHQYFCRGLDFNHYTVKHQCL